MTRSRKTIAWLSLFIACAAIAWLGFGQAHGHFTVTVNGEQIEGAPKLLIGSVGLLVAGIVTFLALCVTTLAVAGSGFLVICSLALVALLLLAVAVPLLLPLVVPIVVVLFVLMIFRRGPRSKRASS